MRQRRRSRGDDSGGLRARAGLAGRPRPDLHRGGERGHKALRAFLHKEKALPREDTYISGYWKIGLIEDEHQEIKRLEAAS